MSTAEPAPSKSSGGRLVYHRRVRRRSISGWLCGVAFVLAVAGCGGGGGDPDGGDGDGDGGVPDAGSGSELLGSIRVLESVFGDYASSYVAGELVLAGYPDIYTETMNDGTCRLVEFQGTFCDPACDQGWCINEVCVPFPEWVDAGQLTVTGLKASVAVAPNYCGFQGWGYCNQNTLPADLFDPGDPVTASAPGGDFPGFAVEASGVAPMVVTGLSNDELDMPNGSDRVFTWTPESDSDRVRLVINANSSGGHGSPYRAIITCESIDDGSLTIPRAMIEAFPETYRWDICAGSDCPPSWAMRYRRGTTAVDDGEVELLVGAQRLFYVIHPLQ